MNVNTTSRQSFPESFSLPISAFDTCDTDEDFSYPIFTGSQRRHSSGSPLPPSKPKSCVVSSGVPDPSSSLDPPTAPAAPLCDQASPKDTDMLLTTAVHPVTDSVLTEVTENGVALHTRTCEGFTSDGSEHSGLAKPNRTSSSEPNSIAMPPLTPSLVRPAHVPRLNDLPCWSDATAKLQSRISDDYVSYDVHPHDIRITDLHSFPVSSHSLPRSHTHSHQIPELTQFDYLSDSNLPALSEIQTRETQWASAESLSPKRLVAPSNLMSVTSPNSTTPPHSLDHLFGCSPQATHSVSSGSPTLSQSPSSGSGVSSPSLEAHSLEAMRMRSANDMSADDDTLTFTDDDYNTALDSEDCRLEPSSNETDDMEGIHYKDENQESADEEDENDEESDNPEMRPATPLNYFVHNGLRYDGDVYELRPPQERSIASRPERILEHKPAPLSHRQIFNRVYSEGTFNARPSSLRQTDVPPSPDTSDSHTYENGADGDGNGDGDDDPQIPAISAAGVSAGIQMPIPLIDTPGHSRPPLPVTRPPSVRPTDGGISDVREKLVRLAAATAAAGTTNGEVCPNGKISQSRAISGGDAFCDDEKVGLSMAAIGVPTGDVLVDENGIPVVNPSADDSQVAIPRRGALGRYARRKASRSYGAFAMNGAGFASGKTSRVQGSGQQRRNSFWKLLSR